MVYILNVCAVAVRFLFTFFSACIVGHFTLDWSRNKTKTQKTGCSGLNNGWLKGLFFCPVLHVFCAKGTKQSWWGNGIIGKAMQRRITYAFANKELAVVKRELTSASTTLARLAVWTLMWKREKKKV